MYVCGTTSTLRCLAAYNTINQQLLTPGLSNSKLTHTTLLNPKCHLILQDPSCLNKTLNSTTENSNQDPEPCSPHSKISCPYQVIFLPYHLIINISQHDFKNSVHVLNL